MKRNVANWPGLLAMIVNAALCLFIVMTAEPVHADNLSATATVSGTHEYCSLAGTNSAACQTHGSLPMGGGFADFAGASSARASYGDLGTSANALADCAGISSPTNCYMANYGSAIADAGFSDNLTITNGPLSGILFLTAFTDGDSLVTCIGPSATFVCGNSIPNSSLTVAGGAINGVTGAVTLPNGQQTWTITLPYTNGHASLSIRMHSQAGCLATNDTNCNGFSNFYNTFGITGMKIKDSNGTVVPNATYTAQSGTDYNHIPAVAEPASVVLLAFGLLTVGAAGRPKKLR